MSDIEQEARQLYERTSLAEASRPGFARWLTQAAFDPPVSNTDRGRMVERDGRLMRVLEWDEITHHEREAFRRMVSRSAPR